MRCPVHVAQEMRPVAQLEARRLKQRGAGLTLEQEGVVERSRNLLPVRCVVANCNRVAFVVLNAGKQERLRPNCGKVSDAPCYRKVIADYRCVDCRNKRLRYWARRRRMEKRAHA